jgi:hypothetical protein
MMWDVDPRPFCRSLNQVAELPDGATVLDVPCGGGVALRGLDPGQSVHHVDSCRLALTDPIGVPQGAL